MLTIYPLNIMPLLNIQIMHFIHLLLKSTIMQISLINKNIQSQKSI